MRLAKRVPFREADSDDDDDDKQSTGLLSEFLPPITNLKNNKKTRRTNESLDQRRSSLMPP